MVYVVITKSKNERGTWKDGKWIELTPYVVYVVEPSYFYQHFDVSQRDFDFVLEPYCKYIDVASESEAETLSTNLKDFFGIYPAGPTIDEWLSQRTKTEIDNWKQYWTNLFQDYPCLLYYINDKYNQFYPTAPESTPEPEPEPAPTTTKEEIIIELGLWNPIGIIPNADDIKGKVNAICNIVGWNCYNVSTTKEKIILNIEKMGSPALPIMAIIGAIAIIIAGAVIISINWRMVRVEEEDTKQEIEKTKQLQNNEDLFNAITDEYNRGLITDEVYNELVEQLGYSQFEISKPITQPTQQGPDWINMLSGALPIVLLIGLLSAIKK